MVPRGLEPRTLRLLAVRSNQLSYETSVHSQARLAHTCKKAPHSHIARSVEVSGPRWHARGRSLPWRHLAYLLFCAAVFLSALARGGNAGAPQQRGRGRRFRSAGEQEQEILIGSARAHFILSLLPLPVSYTHLTLPTILLV